MKVVRIIGGLGNQMFQYAFFLALKDRYKYVSIDVSSYKFYKLHDYQIERIFNLIKLERSGFFSILFFRIFKNLIITKEDTLFHSEIFEMKGCRYFAGYWNSENYFINIQDQVKSTFQFKNKLVGRNEEIAKEIINSNSVSIHVRRGDYINSSENELIYGNICTLNYYRQAIDKMQQLTGSSKYFIFSNDIVWCRENLCLDNCEYVYWNSDKENYIDMQLMSLCKNNIIANSSFSWWGAWLNNNENKIVISPSKFFNDVIPSDMETLIPSNWIRIPV
jgi:hypothetical protein